MKRLPFTGSFGEAGWGFAEKTDRRSYVRS